MKQDIEDRLTINLRRVRNLIARYPATGSGRRSVEDSDLLRAAVVLLHATLEDVVRGVLEWKLPGAASTRRDARRVQRGRAWQLHRQDDRQADG